MHFPQAVNDNYELKTVAVESNRDTCIDMLSSVRDFMLDELTYQLNMRITPLVVTVHTLKEWRDGQRLISGIDPDLLAAAIIATKTPMLVDDFG